MEDSFDKDPAKHGDSTPTSPLRSVIEEHRFRSESEPIKPSISTISLTSSLASDRDSVISTSSASSSDAYAINRPGLIIHRSSSTRSAPADTLMRGTHLPGDSDGYFEGDPDDQEPHDGGPRENGRQDDEEDDEGNDIFPDDAVSLRTTQQSNIIRKSAIRRTHTVTPVASPRITARRSPHRASSTKAFEKITSYATEPTTGEGENFSITVDLPTCKELILYPARRGVTLRDALKEISQDRNFTPAQVNVFVDSSRSPTPLETQCYCFADRQLHVKDKEYSKYQKELIERFNSKPINPALLVDRTRSISTSVVPSIHVENGNVLPPRPGGKKDLSKFLGVETGQKGRTRRPSLPGNINSGTPQAVKKQMDPKLESLQKKLDAYTIEGLPDFPSLIMGSPMRDDDDEELLRLESDWRHVVEDHQGLPRRITDQQEAIWEIVNTEVKYIKNIRVIIDVYMTCLMDLQARGIMSQRDPNMAPIKPDKIFSNIMDIEIKHSKFWKDKLVNVMKVARETKKLLSAADVAKAFEGFGDHFQPYIKFCQEERSCMEYVRERQKEDEQFQLFVRWCQDYKDSRRMKLDDLLVYPMQRMCRYPLLLKAIAKKTDNEAEKQAVNNELSNVEAFCNKINNEVRLDEETRKMKKMTERIELYDWPEIPPGAGAGTDEVKKLINETPEKIDLLSPMQGACTNQPRWVVYEGSVRIRDQYTTNRFECTLVIFTDMITICKKGKTRDNSLRIVRPPIKVGTLKTTELKDNSGFVILCFNEFNCASNWYIVSTQTTALWLQNINKAKEMYENACADKGMDKFLDNSQSSYLQLPEFLRERSSPRTSPLNSPRLPQKSPLSQDSFSMHQPHAPKINGDKEEKTGDDLGEEEDLCEKDSLSSMESSQDADEEESDSTDETPKLTRPFMFPNDRRESLKNNNKSETEQSDGGLYPNNTLTPTSMDFMNFSEPSPTSPSPQAVQIMAFDDELYSDEDPSNPTPYSSILDNSATTKAERTKAVKNTFKITNISKAFSRSNDRSRRPVPNNVVKTQLADQGPSSSDESCGDTLEGRNKDAKKDKKSFFSKSKNKKK